MELTNRSVEFWILIGILYARICVNLCLSIYCQFKKIGLSCYTSEFI